MAYNHSVLTTTVKNISGGSKYFGFLPPHGIRLASNAQVEIAGDLIEAVIRGDRSGNRNVLALLDALENGDISITSTPMPILFDRTTHLAKSLKLTNGTLSVETVSYEESIPA